MNALSHQKHADIPLWQKEDFFTIRELVRDSKWTIFQHESTTDSAGSECALFEFGGTVYGNLGRGLREQH